MISKLGFTRGRIVECVVTTYNEDGSPNAAPMGVYGDGKHGLVLKVHSDCDTYSNILRTKGCVVNLIYDPLLILRTTLTGRGRGGDEPELGDEEVGRAEAVTAPFIRYSHAYLEAKLKGWQNYLRRDAYGACEVSIMRCEAVKEVIKHRYPQGLNRGVGAAVELAVKLSRGEKEGCEEHLRIIRRTLARDEYDKILAFLEPYLQPLH